MKKEEFSEEWRPAGRLREFTNPIINLKQTTYEF